jgi:transposase
MNQKSHPEAVVREIHRQTRRKFSSEEKIRIILEGLRGEEAVAPLCRREGISPNLYYRWSKAFLEAGRKRLNGDTQREASSEEVGGIRQENEQLKAVVAELLLKNRVLKKSLSGWESGSDE